MLKPNANYRANADRAIYIQGRIDQQLIDRLTPAIVSLQNKGRDPITVYIDSPGGSTASADALARLLQASDQDYSMGCRLITVVTGRAASAAADLLCSGSYAMALPESVIFFHGVRRLSDDPITVTEASAIMESLRLTNDRYARALAEKSLARFGFRYISLRSKFDDYRQKIDNPTEQDLTCFVGMISENLSGRAIKVVQRALARNQKHRLLADRVGRIVTKRKRFTNSKRYDSIWSDPARECWGAAGSGPPGHFG